MAKVDLTEVSCWCGLPFAIPYSLYKECHQSGQSFICPLGHSNVYKDSENDQLRRERNRLKQRLAERDDRIREEEKRSAAFKGQITKLKKRASAGVCPCCNRTFQNLANHMKNKHPKFAEPELQVIEGGKS